MQKISIIIISFLIFFSSCAQRNDSAILSYTIIHSAILFTKPIQQKFIDKATESLNAIHFDKNAVIDTKLLLTLLDSAKSANKKLLLLINSASDVNDGINYKEKTIENIRISDTLYNNEFETYLIILNTKTDDRYERSIKVLLPRLLEWKKSIQEVAYASEETKNKYNIQSIDHSTIIK